MAKPMTKMNFLKKAFTMTQKKIREEDPGRKTETNIGGLYMIIQDSLSDSLQLPISRSCLALEVSRSGYFISAVCSRYSKGIIR